ncbi:MULTISPECIES: solute carrier family 23 protein [unclassified Actinomyces]|uniref:uracil-xanthine permease family protein n=1 Tax=unclassified Actinomyces TaxID=2609248 RepID=UPI002016FF78|nr:MULTISPECIES: solute carrier family 23 protein [unclassified Actinomyces]MCL3778491.1 nitrate reductase [Actinomyces sp. AC-20-1]MCL3789685.1 nitrate reductase [Actinomyces sp. 187325]MCL3792827.1 nitrate reductase [Actinomyces sp. 186855]MCL3795393.1 nitrate reductase [Actinomyces sp. 217892]
MSSSTSSRRPRGWTLHGDGRSIAPGEVVAPHERLTWPRTIGIGVQHVVAMFGATFLVPLLTGFDPSTTLFFTGFGTLLFLAVTSGRLPSYLGSSFALIAPIGAVTGYVADGGGPIDDARASLAQGGVIAAGLSLALIGVVVHFAGTAWIDRLMPPIVTGAIVSLIGFNLAPSAWNNVRTAPVTAMVTIVSILLITVLFKGIIGRLSILIGVLIGYATACVRGEVNFDAIAGADWVGVPAFRAPSFDLSLLGLFVPVVLVLVAENIGHVKSVAAMTGENLDGVTGRALFADGVSTALAGVGGGSGTTTYAENIGVMAATRVYSTAAYVVAAVTALGLSMLPKFGEIIATIPAGVLGGAATILYGMIGMLGVRIWVQNRVDFADPVNLNTAAVAMVVAIADYTWHWGDMTFTGIALGSIAAIAVYHTMRWVSRARGTNLEQASPASAPAGADLEGPAYSSRARQQR